MGASESSIRWAPPSQQAPQQGQATPNENREPIAQSEFDPRSPSSNVERTPVRMKVSTAHVPPPDPRSPTCDFQRTPLRGVKDKSENLGQVLFPGKDKAN